MERAATPEPAGPLPLLTPQTTAAVAMTTARFPFDAPPCGAPRDRRRGRRLAGGWLWAIACLSPSPAQGAWGDATIAAQAGPWPIEIRTCAHDAGAICSLTWRNRQFIDDFDHGRQLQSASSFDGLGEAFNPTEAGSRADGRTPKPSTSVLRELKVSRSPGSPTDNVLETTTQMAFWDAVDGVKLSQHLLKKQVTIGLPGMAHVIEYKTEFRVPADETHAHGVFEALTGYMPAEFSRFYTFDVRQQATDVVPLSDGPGEQSLPVIFATANGNHAMGVYSPDSPQADWATVGYGRWRFTQENVVKWNNVFRFENPEGAYRFRSYVAVGSLENVKVSLTQIHQALAALPAAVGDYDLDGRNAGSDLLAWQRDFGGRLTGNPTADGNRDGIVDAVDLALWAGHFPSSAQMAGAALSTHVPEPGSAAVLLLAGAWAARRPAVARFMRPRTLPAPRY